jgi:hypothetical protein
MKWFRSSVKQEALPPVHETDKRLVARGLRRPEPTMSLPRTVADVISQHVTLELQCMDRLYLNVYQPKLQVEQHVFYFLRQARGQQSVSSRCFAEMTRSFIKDIEAYAQLCQVPLISFSKKQRKEDLATQFRNRFSGTEGILFIGKVQEKVGTFRTEGRIDAKSGKTYPWLVRSTAMVNQYYFYGMDDEFGPFFIKFSSYFPFGAKLCLNCHEYVKRQLTKEGIAFEALDNGILSCANPKRMQEIADGLSPEKIDQLLRKWLALLPHPFLASDRKAGYRYDVSITQAEFSLTQVLDRPVAGRMFFEEVIRENLDLGRPDQVQLIFERRVSRRTPGRFRTRVVTEGVVPSLHIDYKHSRIKQYFKERRALRTETTINDTYDFDIGRRLENLPALRELGFAANRRLLDVQRASQDCCVGEEVFRDVTSPRQVGTQRASALPYGGELTLLLFHLLLLFRSLPVGFRNKDLRVHLAQLRGQDPASSTPGQMTYQLRRLRLHGLIERQVGTQRYRVTDRGMRVALFFTRSYSRLIRPGMTDSFDEEHSKGSKLRRALDQVDRAMDEYATFAAA